MTIKETSTNSHGVDKGLVAMFIQMSAEERLQANDNAARTIKELRDAYEEKRKGTRSGPERGYLKDLSTPRSNLSWSVVLPPLFRVHP